MATDVVGYIVFSEYDEHVPYTDADLLIKDLEHIVGVCGAEGITVRTGIPSLKSSAITILTAVQ